MGLTFIYAVVSFKKVYGNQDRLEYPKSLDTWLYLYIHGGIRTVVWSYYLPSYALRKSSKEDTIFFTSSSPILLEINKDSNCDGAR